MLVTAAQYRTITGDNDTADELIDEQLADVQTLLEGELRRPLETGTHVEYLEIHADGRCYPTVTPVVSSDDGTVAGNVIVSTGGGGFLTDSAMATITYVGGFDPAETDRDSRTYVPLCIRRDIVWVAFATLRPADISKIPAGVASTRLGDAAVTYDGNGSVRSTNGIDWSAQTLRWKAR